MLVLGVDPGTQITGWGLVHCSRGAAARYVAHGEIKTSPRSPLWERLQVIHTGIGEITAKHKPDALSIEQCFVSKNVQSALKLGHTRGVIMVAAQGHGASVHEYTPMQIKRAVTGSGRSDKHQVAEMVRMILGLAKTAPSDASDALAAALCHGQYLTTAAALVPARPRSGRHRQPVVRAASGQAKGRRR